FGLSSLAPLFLAAMFVNGLAQSSGWPGNIKAMAEWVPSARRGRVMGLWATCYQVGGIAASAVAQWFLNAHGWRAAFIGPGLCIAAVGMGVLWGPGRGPLAGQEPSPETADLALADAQRAARRRVLRSVTVWSYGASYFCIKLIRYSLLFWLPYYLVNALGYD